MSRIGKLPIALEKNTEVQITADNNIVFKSGGNTQSVWVHPSIEVVCKDNIVTLNRKNDEQQTRAYHGLYRALLFNAMVGVTKGWKKELELNGVGYRALVKGSVLELYLGYSHLIKYTIPKGIVIKVEKNTKITITGVNRETVGQVAATIRSYRPTEPYLGKGVRYSDERIRRKAGKSASKS